MKQYAIRWTKENTSVVAAPLTYETPETLLEEYSYMFDTHDTVILGMDVLSDGPAMVAYVKSEYHFAAASDIPVNATTYTLQYEF